MRTIKYNNGEYKLQSHVKTGIVVTVYINSTTSQIFYWGSWRKFKKYIKY